MPEVNETINKNAGIVSLFGSLIMVVVGVFVQVSFDRLFGDLDRLKESQAVMQTRLDNNIASMQDIRVAVKDSDGQIQNLVIRVSVLEEKISKGGKNALTGR